MSGMSDLVEQTNKRLARRIQEKLMADLENNMAEMQADMALLGIPSKRRLDVSDANAFWEKPNYWANRGIMAYWIRETVVLSGCEVEWSPFTRIVDNGTYFGFQSLLDLPLRVDPRCEQ